MGVVKRHRIGSLVLMVSRRLRPTGLVPEDSGSSISISTSEPAGGSRGSSPIVSPTISVTRFAATRPILRVITIIMGITSAGIRAGGAVLGEPTREGKRVLTNVVFPTYFLVGISGISWAPETIVAP